MIDRKIILQNHKIEYSNSQWKTDCLVYRKLFLKKFFFKYSKFIVHFRLEYKNNGWKIRKWTDIKNKK